MAVKETDPQGMLSLLHHTSHHYLYHQNFRDERRKVVKSYGFPYDGNMQTHLNGIIGEGDTGPGLETKVKAFLDKYVLNELTSKLKPSASSNLNNFDYPLLVLLFYVCNHNEYRNKFFSSNPSDRLALLTEFGVTNAQQITVLTGLSSPPTQSELQEICNLLAKELVDMYWDTW